MTEGTVAQVLANEASWSVVTGDCVELVRQLPNGLDYVTDPPWPNAPAGMFDCDPWDVWSRLCATEQIATARRLTVYIGRTSDPRFLACVPQSLGFVCVCWVEFCPCFYMGPVLGAGNIIYVFGERTPGTGYRCIPGKCTSPNIKREREEQAAVSHPTNRGLTETDWMIRYTTNLGNVVVDPFAGSSSIGVACLRLGRRYIGIELKPEWAEESKQRLRAEESMTTMAKLADGQGSLWH